MSARHVKPGSSEQSAWQEGQTSPPICSHPSPGSLFRSPGPGGSRYRSGWPPQPPASQPGTGAGSSPSRSAARFVSPGRSRRFRLLLHQRVRLLLTQHCLGGEDLPGDANLGALRLGLLPAPVPGWWLWCPTTPMSATTRTRVIEIKIQGKGGCT